MICRSRRLGTTTIWKPTGFTGALLKPFITTIYPELAPDIVVHVEDSIDSSPWGVAGEVVAMPGHAPGSLVVILADRPHSSAI